MKTLNDFRSFLPLLLQLSLFIQLLKKITQFLFNFYNITYFKLVRIFKKLFVIKTSLYCTMYSMDIAHYSGVSITNKF